METATVEKTETRNEVYKREFGTRFAAALDARGLSRSEAARQAGLNTGRITEYATGKRLIPLDKLDEIITKLDLDPRILFPGWMARILSVRTNVSKRDDVPKHDRPYKSSRGRTYDHVKTTYDATAPLPDDVKDQVREIARRVLPDRVV